MKAAADFGVAPGAGERGRYHVRSSMRGGLLYLVDLDEFDNGWCGCRGFEVISGMSLYSAPPCKHIRIARVYQGLQRQFGNFRKEAKL